MNGMAARRATSSLHGFYMWLDNYIYNQPIPVDFTGLTPPPG